MALSSRPVRIARNRRSLRMTGMGRTRRLQTRNIDGTRERLSIRMCGVERPVAQESSTMLSQRLPDGASHGCFAPRRHDTWMCRKAFHDHGTARDLRVPCDPPQRASRTADSSQLTPPNLGKARVSSRMGRLNSSHPESSGNRPLPRVPVLLRMPSIGQGVLAYGSR